MAKQQGWIKLNRAILSHNFWTEERVFSRAEAWIDLLLATFFDAREIAINGQVVKVEAGQYCTTVAHLAKRWGWSRGKVDRYLNGLEMEQMLSIKRTSKYTLLTVLNWRKYQSEITETSTSRTSNEHQTNIKRTQNKNYKNIKEYKKNKIYSLAKYYDTDDRDLSEFEE